MVEIKSMRAKKFLERPEAMESQKGRGMKMFPYDDVKVWVQLEWESQNVKKLSFYGELGPLEKILFESLAQLLKNRPLTFLDQLSLRECEAFLRDKNSEPAIVGMTEVHESLFKKITHWLRNWSRTESGVNYHFHSGRGPFKSLKLVDKIRELKAFLASSKILTLYENSVPPELIDVEDLTVFVAAPYSSETEKSLFHDLHLLGVEAFQEENLNFIPEP